jgi:hypothetical protein
MRIKVPLMITLPDSPVRLLAPMGELDYFHRQDVTLARPVTPMEVWNLGLAKPMPLFALAFRIRDAISNLFGVKRIGGFTGQKAEAVAVGDRLDFFLVEYVDDQALVLTERDRHLDVMTCISVEGRVASITSSVITHNRFGRAYMIPVGLAHPWIVRITLGRLQASV